jgi:hypothetical protein
LIAALHKILASGLTVHLGFMNSKQIPKSPKFFFKGFPADVRFRNHSIPESLEHARGTLYEAWFNAIRLSPYLAESIDTGVWRNETSKEVYEQFGDVRGVSFDDWWVERGYSLFAEGKPFSRITLEPASGDTETQVLTITIPLNVSPRTLRDQFDDILEQHHPHYRDFDRWRASTARVPMRNSRLTSVSINLWLQVYETWVDMGGLVNEVHLYEVGEKLKLHPLHMVKRGDLHNDIVEKHQQMSLVVSEYLGKAKNLIAHASAEGWFPFAVNHNWVERSTRAQHERYEEG